MENKAREEIATLLTRCLEDGDLPWVQGYQPMQASYNPVTNTVYRNTNRFILYMNEYMNGYKDPRWMTLKQANKEGYTIKKGAKGVRIEYWSMHDQKENKNYSYQEANEIIANEPERKDDFTHVSQVFIVFNGTQIDGLEEYVPGNLTFENYEIPMNVIETFIENVHLKVYEDEDVEVPFYNMKEDVLAIPDRYLYHNEEAYFSDMFHELAHATAHESRLNRYSDDSSIESYAMEELRAELASVYLCLNFHMTPHSNHDYKENSVAYIQSWLKYIDEKPHTLFASLYHAQKISDYILKFGNNSMQEEK